MVVVVFLFQGYSHVFAQQPDSISRVKFPHFTTFTEIGGSAGMYSQNVEFFISNNRTVNFNFRAGIGGMFSDEIFAPFLVNAIIGRKKSKLEIGVGLLVGARVMATTIGYRHQSNNGLFYRITFTPHYNTIFSENKFLPWGGLSLGYYFGYRKTKEEVKRKPLVNLDSADNKLNLIIKTDLFLPGFYLANKMGYGSLTIEKGFKRRHSAQLTGIYAGSEYKETNSDTTWHHRKTSGFQIIPEYKYFFGKRRYYTGFYSGAYAKYAYIKTEMDSRGYYCSQGPCPNNSSYTSNQISAGIIIGYQNYIIKRRVVIDVLAGWGNMFINSNNGLWKFQQRYNPDGRIAVNVGYRF